MKNPSHPIVYFFIRDVIGRLVAEITTSVCYFKLYKQLKENTHLISFSRRALLRLFWYSTIPIIWYFPTVIYYDLCKKEQTPLLNAILSSIIMVLRYFWEFCNLWAYWNLKSNKGEQNSEVDEDMLSSSVDKSLIL